MYKSLIFTRGQIRIVDVQFELNVPIAIIDGHRIPLDAALLRHVLQDDVAYWYAHEVLHP